jgi:CHAT domain-containing protein
MLVYALGDFSYVWVVTQEKAVFRSLSAILRTVAAQVASVRSEMDFDDKGHPIKVSVDGLHALYKGLVEPIAADLTGISHVMVVPSGPLQSLPMGLLVAAPPPEIRSDADYGAVEWLAKRYAFSVLPSVSAIQAFRQFAKVAQVQQRPFAGFGDPNIGSGTSTTRGARAKLDMASVFRGLTLALAMGSAGTRGPEIADVESIRRAPRLPETADELRQMAKATGAGDQSVWLQNSATETQVKQMDLSSYRILAFATHGLMAGELKGVGEPGLIMTPPKVGSVEDDGYLAAGEISRLKLNADWVVLSACNTAAADGSPGAEGLSGLAKAFFYAGARSLLVSHWPVASEATVPLTTVMLKEYEANPQAGKAQAQRKAILALMNTPGHPEYAHPLFWAPFVVVGEGGAGLSAQRK